MRKTAFVVTFDTAGGSEIESVSVVNGRAVSRPANDPVKEGFTFAGWYEDARFTRPFGFGTTAVTSNMTVFARFEPIAYGQSEYTVFFDLNYDGKQPESAETLNGKLLEAPQPERDGYVFKGWWISMYEDRDMLSYAYAEGMVLGRTPRFSRFGSLKTDLPSLLFM